MIDRRDLALVIIAVGSVAILAVAPIVTRAKPPPPQPVTQPPPTPPPPTQIPPETPPKPPVEIQPQPPPPVEIQPQPPPQPAPPPPPTPPTQPPPYPEVPTPEAIEEWRRAWKEYARQVWERIEERLRTYGGYAVIFKTMPPDERVNMFLNMLLNININTRGMCVYGAGCSWNDYLEAYVCDVGATWVSYDEARKRECKRHIRAAIESAFAGYYTEVREY